MGKENVSWNNRHSIKNLKLYIDNIYVLLLYGDIITQI